MMSYNEKKKYLTIHRNTIFTIQRLRKQLQKTKDALGLRGISYTSMPKGHGLTQEDLTIEKIDLEERIGRLCEENRRRKKIIEKAAEKMENKKLACIVELYFLRGFDEIDISIEFGNHTRTIEKNIKKAIAQIEI